MYIIMRGAGDGIIQFNFIVFVLHKQNSGPHGEEKKFYFFCTKSKNKKSSIFPG